MDCKERADLAGQFPASLSFDPLLKGARQLLFALDLRSFQFVCVGLKAHWQAALSDFPKVENRLSFWERQKRAGAGSPIASQAGVFQSMNKSFEDHSN